jgi:lipoprotein NlpD
MNIRNIAFAALCALILAGCASTRHPAPVSDRTQAPAPAPKAAPAPAAVASQLPREPDTRPETYTVKRGDTLYSIALDHGLDYK